VVDCVASPPNVLFLSHSREISRRHADPPEAARCGVEGVAAMQVQYIGGIGDFAKLALLRHLMDDRHLAVCWYLTRTSGGAVDHEKHFAYLKRPDDFRHLAPEVFDRCREIASATSEVPDPITAVQTSGLLAEAFFHRREVPTQVSLRRLWSDELVSSVIGADLVLLDPDNGVEGSRLTPKHVAVREIAALRQTDRALVICHRQSGRRAEAKFLFDRMRSLGCDRVELIRFKLVSSRFYVICDHDAAMSDRLGSFVRKWGSWVKSYALQP
jgi:hypothetical protein